MGSLATEAMSTTYLITGTNRGLGFGLVEAYLKRPDATVIAAMRDPASSSAPLQKLPKGTNSRLIVVKIDSSSLTDAEEAIASLKSEHNIKSLDVVVANAGIARIFPTVHEVEPKDMLEHFTINVIGTVKLFQAVRPLLLESANAGKGKNPQFVTMGSTAGSIADQESAPIPNAAYGLSKAGLNWITKKIYLENKDLGISAWTIHPGWVQTEMGNAGARALGFEKAQIVLEESIDGMTNVIDNATLGKTAGKFLSYQGTPVLW